MKQVLALSLSCHLGCQPCSGPRLLPAILRRGVGGARVYLSISFEVHQIKGSKITDADEVGIDSDGICVSERGPGELPPARGDLGVLKPGQASKDKNCQVMAGGETTRGWSMHSVAAGVPLLGVTVSRLDLEGLSWSPRCRPPSWLPALAAPVAGQGVLLPVYPWLSRAPVLGQGERRELGVGPRHMAEWSSNATRESPPVRAGQSAEGLCWSDRPALKGRSEAGPPPLSYSSIHITDRK